MSEIEPSEEEHWKFFVVADAALVALVRVNIPSWSTGCINFLVSPSRLARMKKETEKYQKTMNIMQQIMSVHFRFRRGPFSSLGSKNVLSSFAIYFFKFFVFFVDFSCLLFY